MTKNLILALTILLCLSCKKETRNNYNGTEVKCGIEQLPESIKEIYTDHIKKNYESHINELYNRLNTYTKKNDAFSLATDFNFYNEFTLKGIRLASKNDEIKKCTCKANLTIIPNRVYRTDLNKFLNKSFISFDFKFYKNSFERDNIEYEKLKKAIIRSDDIRFEYDIEYSVQLTEDGKNYYIEAEIPTNFESYFNEFFNSNIYLYNEEYLKGVLEKTWE